MPDIKGQITEADRQAFSAAMDLIVPPVEGMAGAGELGLAKQAEEIAAGIPRFHDALTKILAALALDPASRASGGFLALDEDEQINSLKSLETSMGQHFQSFIELIFTAYYSDPRVHQRIDWRTGPLQPLGWDLAPFDPSILEVASQREPFWRRV